MSDLVEFLRARLDEDESMLWRFSDWSKDRVLREVEAKREVVDGALGCYEAAERDGDDFQRGIAVGHTIALRCLASIYSDHPDYRDEWR